MRAARWALAVASVLWAVSLPLAAFIANQSAQPSPASFFALAVYAVGGVICHQRPERSYHFLAAQLPVCARCTGIYFGAAVGAIVAVVGAELVPPGRGVEGAELAPPARGRPRPAPTTLIVVLALAALPALATLAYESFTGRTPSNDVRALSGVVLGAATSWLVLRHTLR
jgi:hypothetical protein